MHLNFTNLCKEKNNTKNVDTNWDHTYCMYTQITKQGERLYELCYDRKVEGCLMSIYSLYVSVFVIRGGGKVCSKHHLSVCVGKMRVPAICEQPCMWSYHTIWSRKLHKKALCESASVFVCVHVNTTHLSRKHFVEQHSICPPVYRPSVWLICNDLCGKKKKFINSLKLKQTILYKIQNNKVCKQTYFNVQLSFSPLYNLCN